MKSILKITFITCTLLTHSAHSMNEKKHIIVPLEGFLFQVNTVAALSEMGTTGALSAAWAGGFRALWRSASAKGPDQTLITEKLFKMLEKVNCATQSTCPEVYWRGIKAPPIIVNEWLKSNKTCKELLTDVLPLIKAEAGTGQGTSLSTLATIIFDATKNASVLSPNQEALCLVKALQEKGHTIHIMDNWNCEAFDQLKDQHKEPFSLINGKTHISGTTKLVKSATSCELHESFFKDNSSIKHQDAVFIETEEQHTAPLTKKTFAHVLCQDADIKTLRIALQKLKLLPE